MLAVSAGAGPQTTGLVVLGGSLAGAGQLAAPATFHTVMLIAPNPTDQLVLSGDLDGDGTLTKLGAGTLVVQGNDNFQGNTVVATGTLIMAGNAVLGDQTSLTIGGGGTFVFDPSATVSAAASPAAAAVPEPGTVWLLAVAGVMLAIGGRPRAGKGRV